MLPLRLPLLTNKVKIDKNNHKLLGLFRIRGLIPNTQYHISVENSSKYSSVKPEVFNIKAQAKDIFDVRIALMKINYNRLILLDLKERMISSLLVMLNSTTPSPKRREFSFDL